MNDSLELLSDSGVFHKHAPTDYNRTVASNRFSQLSGPDRSLFRLNVLCSWYREIQQVVDRFLAC